MARTLNILAVFGVQIALWFFFPWWIALSSLPLAFLVVSGASIAIMPLVSKLANTIYWFYYQLLAPPFFFALGQISSALILQAVFL